MLTYNFHGHTNRCGHAQGTDEDYVKTAIENGFTHMGFADHAPFIGVDEPNIRMAVSQFEEYYESINVLKHHYRDRIHIYTGLECENYPNHRKELEQYKEKLDYLLLGQHNDRPGGQSFYRVQSDDDILKYADYVIDGLRSDLFDVLVHPDIFMFGQESWNLTCQKVTEKICSEALAHHVGLEVNLNGIRYGLLRRKDGERYAYPHPEFWRIVSEANVPCVYGLDAHHPEKYADTGLELIQDILQGIPLNISTSL